MIKMIGHIYGYQNEILRKMRETWFMENYKFYYANNVYSDAGFVGLITDTLDRSQFVSVNKNNELVGYISYNIDRQANYVYNFEAINFTDNKIVFGVDIKEIIYDIFYVFNFNKIVFSVIVGNPIEKSYDILVKKYGGRVVGVYKEDLKLTDGNLYNRKTYEIMRDDFKNHRSNEQNILQFRRAVDYFCHHLS